MKRRLFLEDAIKKLGLEGVRLECALPEDRFADLFTARAVYPPTELMALMKRRLKPGGRFILNLGGSTDAPPIPSGLRTIDSQIYDLPEGAGSRKNLVLELVPRETK